MEGIKINRFMKTTISVLLITIISSYNVFAADKIEPRFPINCKKTDIVAELFTDGDAVVSSYGTDMKYKQALLQEVQSIVDAVSTTGTTPVVKGQVSNQGKPNETTHFFLVNADDDFTPLEIGTIINHAGNTSQEINSYIVENVAYDYSVSSNSGLKLNDPISTAKGALTNGLGICQGYANAFSLIAEEAGIKNVKVRGYLNNGYHVINVVDFMGEFMAVDVTSNDTTFSDDYLMIPFDDYCLKANFRPTVDVAEMIDFKYGA